MSRRFYGWDIGGAHLKLARLNTSGEVDAVRQLACPLWRGLDELQQACAALDFDLTDNEAVHAVTMTGELCDVFPDRDSGVRAIVASLYELLGSAPTIRVFAGYRGWLRREDIDAEAVAAIASANWLALGAYTAERIGDGVLIDIGSTTTDLIAIFSNEVACRGNDDASRLAHGELVYTGVVRTPVFGVCAGAPFRGRVHPFAAEVFATMADVYRLLERLIESEDLMPSADGGAKDTLSSARRLARMIGHDFLPQELTEMTALAHYVADQQRFTIEQALAINISRTPPHAHAPLLVGAGQGRFIVEQIAHSRRAPYVDFADLLDEQRNPAIDVSLAAPAVAAAKLAWMTM